MLEFRWNAWNVGHIGRHGVGRSEAEAIVRRPSRGYPRRAKNDSFLVRGRTVAGRYLQVVFVVDPRPRNTRVRYSRTPADRGGEAALLSAPRSFMSRKKKSLSQMPPAELERAASAFDQEFVATKPLTNAMKASWRRAKRGRPRVGEGSTAVLISIERGLLRRTDRYAKKRKLSRSQVIAQGVRTLLKAG